MDNTPKFTQSHPLAVNWTITYRCLRNCRYCLTDSGIGLSEELVPDDRLRAIEIFSSLGVRRISIMGGEPFLLEDVHLVANYAWLHGIITNFTTSGSGCTADRLAVMKQGLQYLNVSLDGPKEYNDHFRGKGSYQSATRAIIAARELDIPVRLYSVLTTENTDPATIDWFFRYAAKHTSMLIMFMFMSPVGRGAQYSSLRVPPGTRTPVMESIQRSSSAWGVRFKCCDPFEPEEFKWFLDADGSLYSHSGGGIRNDLGHLLKEPDGRAWDRLTSEQKEIHRKKFTDLIPRVTLPLPVTLNPPQGMVYIPPGVYRMGGNVYERETSVHSVYLDGFFIDTHETTNAQYSEFLNTVGNRNEGGVDWIDLESPCCLIEYVEGRFRAKTGYDDYPVVVVSWFGASAYAHWAGKRLPTESEWEKAARGGMESKTYPWGDEPPGNRCNWLKYDGIFKSRRPDFYHGRGPLTVGMFPPNGFGLFDMAGNVWEWCEDSYLKQNYGENFRINPLESTPASLRILRGGSWSFDPINLRNANRSYAEPHTRESYDGFRCALSGIQVLKQ